jgi:3-deoxy-D-manno-octulosonic acid kinase
MDEKDGHQQNTQTREQDEKRDAPLDHRHARGVQHADLNAHNILLDHLHKVFVLDFDRGRLRRHGRWEWQVLARLERSLQKVTQGLPRDRFGIAEWNALLAGYGPG